MTARILFAAILFFAMSACSNQYRNSDPQISSETMMSWLNDATTSAQNLGGGSTDISALLNSPGTTIYFADAPGPMGTVASVLSFDNLNFIGASPFVVTGARVFFLDNPNFNGGGRQDALIVGIANASAPDQFQYRSFSGSGYLDSGEFLFSFTGSDGVTYTARSFDLDGDNLGANIQLGLWDSNGVKIGKFSTLAGFQ